MQFEYMTKKIELNVLNIDEIGLVKHGRAYMILKLIEFPDLIP